MKFYIPSKVPTPSPIQPPPPKLRNLKYMQLAWGLLLLSGKDAESILDAIKSRVDDINWWQQQLFKGYISPTDTILNQIWFHLSDKHSVERKLMRLLSALKTDNVHVIDGQI